MFTAIKQKEMSPFKTVLREYPRNIIGAIFCVFMVAFYGVIISLYLPKYLTMHLHYEISQVNHLMTISFIINILATILTAWVSDYINYRKLFKIISCCMILFIYPTFYLINQHNEASLTAGLFLLSLFPSMAAGIFMRIICEVFPTAIRLSGVAISYNIAFAVVGGIAPLSIEFLIYIFDPLIAPVIISFCCALFGYCSMLLLARVPAYV